MFLGLAMVPQSAGEHIHHSASYIEEIEGDASNTPFEVQFIDVDQHQSIGAYENTFTTMPDNGKKLTVKVRNLNSWGKVILNFYRGTEEFGYMDVKARREGIRTFAMNDGSGVTGDWKVYITTRDGHVMNLQVQAGQHESDVYFNVI